MFVFPAGGEPNLFGSPINKSVRFDGAANYFSRAAAGTTSGSTKWTFSAWVKRAEVNTGNYQAMLSAYYDASNYELVWFDNADRLIATGVHSGVTFQVKTTNRVFRDTGQWYHIFVVCDTTLGTAGDRLQLWVNGVRETSFASSTDPSVSHATYQGGTGAGSGWGDYVGVYPGPLYWFNGYLAEVHVCNQSAQVVTDFGQTNPKTGEWVPKLASGITYGNRGFYLDFADNSSAAALGYDAAGSNDLTANGFSVTAGVNNDSLSDTPTYNYPIMDMNSISWTASGHSYVADGSMYVQGDSGANWAPTNATFALPRSGKWYWEAQAGFTAASVYSVYGIANVQTRLVYGATGYPGNASDGYGYESAAGNKYNNASGAAYGSSYATNDIVGVAYDADSGKIWFSKNGTWAASGDPAAGTNAAYTGIDTTKTYIPQFSFYGDGSSAYGYAYVNFGQRAFNTTPPTGFKALNARNMPKPVIKDGSKYFVSKTYTGNGSTNAITGLSFQPDLVWIKNRTDAASAHHDLFDSTRGAGKILLPSSSLDEITAADTLTSFDSGGFTLGANAGSGNVNVNAKSYISWAWKKGATPGLDIVTYTGTGVARTISHSLGVAPGFIVAKARTTAGADVDPSCYHVSLGATDYVRLSSTAATAADAGSWNNTAPTSSVFSVGTGAATNANNDTFVAWLFAEVAGFSRIGKYTGNGGAVGPFVWCGFRPAFVLAKRSDGVGSWVIVDNARDTYNVENYELYIDATSSEATAAAACDFLANGFKVRNANNWWNTGSANYIFIAFADSPFRINRAR